MYGPGGMLAYFLRGRGGGAATRGVKNWKPTATKLTATRAVKSWKKASGILQTALYES